MRIEKISDTQVKFILMQSDLAERNIKLNELSYGSDKAHQLFREMMQLAQEECEFQTENSPLMFETVRVGVDCVVVIVTKIADINDIEKRLNLIPTARSTARFKRNGLIEQNANIPGEDSLSIFSFEDFDTTADAASRLKDFTGISRVYKCDGRYFLLLQNETENNKTTPDLEAALHEYGQKHISNIISRQYLVERGEVLIAENAVDKLMQYAKPPYITQ